LANFVFKPGPPVVSDFTGSAFNFIDRRNRFPIFFKIDAEKHVQTWHAGTAIQIKEKSKWQNIPNLLSM
jgi:hypothetical protein